MSRNNFTFYRSFAEGLKGVDDATFRRLVTAIMEYALDDEEPELSGIENTVFLAWKANIDASNKRKDNGKLGGRPSSENHRLSDEKPLVSDVETIGYEGENHRLEGTKPNIKEKEKENIKVKEKEKENSKENKGGRFAPPSLDEIKDYCLERNNKVDPEGFYDFYQSKGWKVGNSPMKDWKAAIRTWEKRDNRASPQKEKFDLDAYLLNIINGEETG